MGKLYVLTRNDLPIQEQAVQGGHALASWMLDNVGHHWNNNTLVFVTVPSEVHLKMWCEKLELRNFRFSSFREPDIDCEMTAISCFTDTAVFSKLPLLGKS